MIYNSHQKEWILSAASAYQIVSYNHNDIGLSAVRQREYDEKNKYCEEHDGQQGSDNQVNRSAADSLLTWSRILFAVFSYLFT